MVVDDIITYIDANSVFTAGTDLFASHFTEGILEGAIIQTGRLAGSLSIDRRNIHILLFYFDNVIADGKFTLLYNLFKNLSGYLGSSWAVSSEVSGEEAGIDNNQRYVYHIWFEVTYQQT